MRSTLLFFLVSALTLNAACSQQRPDAVALATPKGQTAAPGTYPKPAAAGGVSGAKNQR